MNCPLCDSSQSKKLFTTKSIPVLSCLNCHCLFPQVKVNSTFYKKYYPHKYYQKDSRILEKMVFKLNTWSKNLLFSTPGTLLDIGCGTGDFINHLPPYIKATGIDIHPSSSSKIIAAEFLKHPFKQKFDYITLWHSLEHFPQPRQVIKKCLRLLKPHGRLFITIPNTDSLAFSLGQKDWFHLDTPRHLFLPNYNNIKLLFPGYSKISILYPFWHFPLDLWHSLKKYPILRLFYPFLKIFDRENMLIVLELWPPQSAK